MIEHQNKTQITTPIDLDNIAILERFKQSLEPLFNPFIRVVPEKDWSKIKAIWIPFLHHDHHKQLEKTNKITILEPTIDKFGTVQGFLTASNENYIPYLTTFFNPVLTINEVIEKILQAEKNIIETECCVTEETEQLLIRKTVIGVAKSGMLISITKNKDDIIIDAFPIFHIASDSSQDFIGRNKVTAKMKDPS